MRKSLAVMLTLAALTLTVSPATAAQSWCEPGSEIVILGDSTATGYGSTGYDPARGRKYQPTRWGWAHRLDARLTNAEITNLALNGATASDFLADGGVDPWPQVGPMQPTAVSRIRAAEPELVIIALGGNEYASQRDPYRTYKKNMITLRDRIRAASPSSKLLFVRMWDFSFRYSGQNLHADSANTYTWYDYGRHLEVVAAKHGYLDLTSYMPKSDDGAGGLYTQNEMGPNRALHATDTGHVVQFDLYWSKLGC